jgi:hypothetical protein
VRLRVTSHHGPGHTSPSVCQSVSQSVSWSVCVRLRVTSHNGLGHTSPAVCRAMGGPAGCQSVRLSEAHLHRRPDHIVERLLRRERVTGRLAVRPQQQSLFVGRRKLRAHEARPEPPGGAQLRDLLLGNRIRLVLLGMHNRTSGHYLAAINRTILTPGGAPRLRRLLLMGLQPTFLTLLSPADG